MYWSNTLITLGFRTFAVVLAFVLFSANFTAGQETTGTPAGAVPTITAERNVQNDSGQLSVIMKRSPGDPRVGETVHVLVSLSENVHGGFGSGPLPIEKAIILLSVIRPDGSVLAENLSTSEEAAGIYRGSYRFDGTGDFKIVFSITTEDKRTFSADFPVTVSRAPIRTSFWIGLLVLLILCGVSAAAIFYILRKRDPLGTFGIRRAAPVVGVLVAVFILSSAILAYLLPPSQTRETSAIPTDAFSTTAVNELPKGATITVSKESQLLFGIKTQVIDTRQITSGLKTTGVVRARPDAKGVVMAQVPGRIVLNQSVSLGSAVGRGEQIGFVEQVLDVSGQAGLESQRLEVEAQQREVEARKLELRNTALALQSQQAQSRSAAGQARTRLAQAQRELRRSQNLL